MLENEFSIRLQTMSDTELIDALNNDVGNPGWYSPHMQVFRNTSKVKFPSYLGLSRKGH